MSYNNNYRGGYSRFNGGGRSFNGQSQFRPQKKRSGAKMGFGKVNPQKPWVRGWKASRHGLLIFMCGPYKNTHRSTSNSGREWENWMCTVTNRNTGQKQIYSCLYDTTTQKVMVKDLGIVINHKAPNGGYCGRFGNKR